MRVTAEKYLSLQEVGDELGVSDQTVRRWVKAGELAAYKPGKEYRIKGSDLEEFLQTREVGPKVQSPLLEPEEQRRAPWEVERWGDLLKHIGGILQDIEGKHDPHGENFAELSTLFFNTVSVYRIANPKAGATPEQLEHLEQAEKVLQRGLQMLEERAEKAHAGVTNLDEYREKKREAVTVLRGTA